MTFPKVVLKSKETCGGNCKGNTPPILVLALFFLYINVLLLSHTREVTVHQKCELSSVLVHLPKKWTKFSSKFTLLKKNLVRFTNLKMNFSVHFSVHTKNISKGSMPKSGPIDNLEVFLWDNVLNIINFLGKSLEFFYLQQNSNGISIF